MKIQVSDDGDVHLMMQEWEEMEKDPKSSPSPLPTLRNRTLQGGGKHLRTHQALLWLAQAIRLDNEQLGIKED